MVSDIAEADPHLLAVQYPIVAVAAGGRAHANHIGTRIRLGQPERRELLPLRLRNKIFLLLLFGSPAKVAQTVKPDVYRHRHPKERVARLELFTNETERN